MRQIRLKFPRLIFALNVICAISLILVCVCSFFPKSIFPPIAALSLFVPLLCVFNVLFFIFWLIKRRKRMLISLMSVSIMYFTFGNFYFLGKSKNELSSGIKILTYNVRGFNKHEWLKKPNVGNEIVGFIEGVDPDVLCVQEHHRIRNRQLNSYPYKVVTPYAMRTTVQGVFSKFPIVNSGFLDLPKTVNNILYADIVYEQDTIRVYNVHLESYKIIPNSSALYDGQSEKKFRRLITTFRKQIEQADILFEHSSNCPYPFVIGGDFNNTQFSNTYRVLRGDLVDSFLEKGNGLGKTYDLFGLPLRIDYILADPSFEVLTHQNFDVKLSDHYPVMATLKLK